MPYETTGAQSSDDGKYYDYSYLRGWSSEEIVQKLLDDYQYQSNWSTPNFWSQVEILLENYRSAIPVLLEYLKRFDLDSYRNGNSGFEMFNRILFRRCWIETKWLNDKEREELIAIYQDKLDKYVDQYRVIDTMAILISSEIKNVKTGVTRLYPEIKEQEARELYEKYTNMGYEHLTINYR
jgi:uncharacterized protein with von Willebrand factor type A (vWA) domain